MYEGRHLEVRNNLEIVQRNNAGETAWEDIGRVRRRTAGEEEEGLVCLMTAHR